MFYYFIIKTYKGIFKKSHAGNINLIFMQFKKSEYLILEVFGGVITERFTYPKGIKEGTEGIATQVVGTFDTALLNTVIEDFESNYGYNFIEVQKSKATLGTPKPNELGKLYNLNLQKGGKYFPKNMQLQYDKDEDVFVFFPVSELEVGDVNMDASFKMTKLKSKAKFKSLSKNIKNITPV